MQQFTKILGDGDFRTEIAPEFVRIPA